MIKPVEYIFLVLAKELVYTKVLGVRGFTCDRWSDGYLWLQGATVLDDLGAYLWHDKAFKHSASGGDILVDIVGAELFLPGVLRRGLVEDLCERRRSLFRHCFSLL